MAMTKAEKAYVESLKDEIDTWKAVAALKLTEPVERDLIAEDLEWNEFHSGWDYVLSWPSYVLSIQVTQRWTEHHRHGDGVKPERIGSQGGINLFSSKERALMAARYELAMKAARGLHQIDKMIEEERAKYK
jgi:hypothetical protein